MKLVHLFIALILGNIAIQVVITVMLWGRWLIAIPITMVALTTTGGLMLLAQLRREFPDQPQDHTPSGGDSGVS